MLKVQQILYRYKKYFFEGIVATFLSCIAGRAAATLIYFDMYKCVKLYLTLLFISMKFKRRMPYLLVFETSIIN